MKFIDLNGLYRFWNNVKQYIEKISTQIETIWQIQIHKGQKIIYLDGDYNEETERVTNVHFTLPDYFELNTETPITDCDTTYTQGYYITNSDTLHLPDIRSSYKYGLIHNISTKTSGDTAIRQIFYPNKDAELPWFRILHKYGGGGYNSPWTQGLPDMSQYAVKADTIPYSYTIIKDANSQSTNGYVRTDPSTLNLPSIADTPASLRIGILFFIAENLNTPTGTQIWYPINGFLKGKIYTRSFRTVNGTMEFGKWYRLATGEETVAGFETYSDDLVLDDFNNQTTNGYRLVAETANHPYPDAGFGMLGVSLFMGTNDSNSIPIGMQIFYPFLIGEEGQTIQCRWYFNEGWGPWTALGGDLSGYVTTEQFNTTIGDLDNALKLING